MPPPSCLALTGETKVFLRRFGELEALPGQREYVAHLQKESGFLTQPAGSTAPMLCPGQSRFKATDNVFV